MWQRTYFGKPYYTRQLFCSEKNTTYSLWQAFVGKHFKCVHNTQKYDKINPMNFEAWDIKPVFTRKAKQS